MENEFSLIWQHQALSTAGGVFLREGTLDECAEEYLGYVIKVIS